MLIEIKFNDTDKIEEFIRQTSLFLREFYSAVLNEKGISLFEKFNTEKTIIREIKEKEYLYCLIEFNDKITGSVLIKKKENFAEIIRLYLLKKYRKQKLSNKIIISIKEKMAKKGLTELRIAIPELNKKLPKIAEKWGFKKINSIARYSGDDIYIYENIYSLN